MSEWFADYWANLKNVFFLIDFFIPPSLWYIWYLPQKAHILHSQKIQSKSHIRTNFFLFSLEKPVKVGMLCGNTLGGKKKKKKKLIDFLTLPHDIWYPRQKSAYLQSKDPVKITRSHKLFCLELREAGNGRIALRITATCREVLQEKK